MKKIIASVTLLIATSSAFATCVGTDSYQTCTDDSGNTYEVQRIGNTTNVQGYNPNTGSSWDQQSTTIGNTTFHSGTSADGGSWNGTSTRIGNTTFNEGIDSDGNPYSSTCNQYGCD